MRRPQIPQIFICILVMLLSQTGAHAAQAQPWRFHCAPGGYSYLVAPTWHPLPRADCSDAFQGAGFESKDKRARVRVTILQADSVPADQTDADFMLLFQQSDPKRIQFLTAPRQVLVHGIVFTLAWLTTDLAPEGPTKVLLARADWPIGKLEFLGEVQFHGNRAVAAQTREVTTSFSSIAGE